jgi:hypothetical protein
VINVNYLDAYLLLVILYSLVLTGLYTIIKKELKKIEKGFGDEKA